MALVRRLRPRKLNPVKLPTMNPARFGVEAAVLPSPNTSEMSADELCAHMTARSDRILRGLPYEIETTRIIVSGEQYAFSSKRPDEAKKTLIQRIKGLAWLFARKITI